jgi:hypothetical protein
MSFSVLGDLNWFAAIVSGLAFFALGGLWYSNLIFGKQWTKATGWEQPEGSKTPVLLYLMPLLTCLVTGLGVAMLAESTGTNTFGEAIVLGLVVGVAVAAMALLVTGFFDPKKPQPMVWVGITAGYHIVGILVISVIVALWQ